MGCCNFLEELRTYYKTTSKEKILEDWEKSKEFDNVILPIQNKEKLKIEFNEYSYECGDGCCTNYGTEIKVNGQEMPYHNQDTETILEQILNHLGYEVEIIRTFNGE